MDDAGVFARRDCANGVEQVAAGDDGVEEHLGGAALERGGGVYDETDACECGGDLGGVLEVGGEELHVGLWELRGDGFKRGAFGAVAEHGADIGFAVG